jgi:hypothetical protein
MSEKPSALSTIPPQPPAEGEYDLICATMAESARGRWFLDEYTRRNRNTDTAQVLAAIERIEAMIRGERDQQAYQSFRGELLDMAKTIAQTRAEAAPPVPAPANPDIFAAAERIQDVAWTMRERGLDPRICQQIEALASSILTASSLRNPDNHRAQKLGEVLHYLERRINAMLEVCGEPAQMLQEQEQALPERALAEPQTAADEGVGDQISIDLTSAYQASPDEEVEAASASLHGGNGHDPDGIHAVIPPDQEPPAAQMAEAPVAIPVASVTIAAEPPPESPAPVVAEEPAAPPAAAAEIAAPPVEPEPQPDPALATTVCPAIPQIELEPLVVVPVAWRKTPAGGPPAELEHAPIPVEPLFPEQRTEAPAAETAAVIPLFRPPEAAVVFLVEYPTDDPPTEATTVTAASMLEAVPLPERLPPVAAPEASVERSVVMIADIDKEPVAPAPAAADTSAAPAPLSHAYPLPIAEPIPQPPAAPAPPPPAAAASAASDPLAALRAMTPEERIALFT